jgi:hypothetical protein
MKAQQENIVYYEERMLGGRLVCRTTPKGEWEECSIEKAWDKIVKQEEELITLRARLRSIATQASEQEEWNTLWTI